ncbi:M1 family metallopeptidase [Adhaeribacter radiodurans]|uniref:M1 family metallopeptidase n=1 Tax=Adhaeribacter radiodurans TaxID=2745197 RepID=A0A7L7LB14_9BACT|nr:M1 family metallopeptidase [Adhaeribacter radiodurans]QMU29927.1 M1 family metallopeptidase [Adhaeribacter radiodurans]
MIKKLIWLFFLLFPAKIFAQAYWQQEVNYKINVTLNDQKHTLTATEELEYSNHSPDQLTFIYFHLWPNAYQNNQTALGKQLLRLKKSDFYFAAPEERGYITNLDFKVNGQSAKLEYDEQNPDIGKLILNEPLLSGQRVVITTPFTVKIPGSFSRFGHLGQSYQITQWFPKPAVYDKKGWHPMPYLDQGEFYSEFGKFEVAITLPANYIVGATGVLQNSEERARMDALAAETAAKTTFTEDLFFPASATETKTLRYVQANIHDFAWFADKRFNVLKSEVILPNSNRTVTTWLLFLNKNATAWVNSLKDINRAVKNYSEWVGEYPYEQATAVDGALSAGSGMEYPMVTVTDPEAIVHEVGHNWFYGILATNERDYAWMDEGINSYYEFRVSEQEDPNYSQLSFLVTNKNLRSLFGLENVHANTLNLLLYQMAASRGLDQPVQLPSANFTSTNYGAIVYLKMGILFKYLAGYLGQERFDKAMQAYFQKWQFRHPYPEDLQAVLEQESGEKLDWFFHNLIKTTSPVDAAVTNVTTSGSTLQVTIQNRSAFPVAVPVAAVDADNKILELHWTGPMVHDQKLIFKNAADARKILIDPENIVPEINRTNNQYKLTGSFPLQEKLKLQFLAGIEQPDRKQLYYLPVVGANTYDKFMLGLAVYNSSLIQKKVNYAVIPLYSFGQNKVNGMGAFNLNILPRKNMGSTTLGFQVSRFERFIKYEPFLTINWPKSSGYAPDNQLRFSSTHVSSLQQVELDRPETNFEYTFAYTIPSVQYRISSNNAVTRLAAKAEATIFIVNQNITTQNKPLLGKLTLEYDHEYQKGKKWQIRFFAGKFFGNKPQGLGYEQFWLGLSGSQDYKKESIFLDRSQQSRALTAFVHQTDNREGAFKNYLPVYADRWLTTLNVAADLPVTPFSTYADLGLASFSTDPIFTNKQTKFYYGSGLSLRGSKLLQLYFPVVGSNYKNNIPSSFKDFTRNIRFALNLAAYNPFQFISNTLKQ